MYDLISEFISHETKKFKFKMGRHIASSLSGFIAGAIFASIIWATGIWISNAL